MRFKMKLWNLGAKQNIIKHGKNNHEIYKRQLFVNVDAHKLEGVRQ
jgi:hypothetical protein